MPENKFVRFRFSVPHEDQDVLAWARAQANLSISLRTLIRDSIRTHGVVDATCLPVVRPTTGPTPTTRTETTSTRAVPTQAPTRPPEFNPAPPVEAIPAPPESAPIEKTQPRPEPVPTARPATPRAPSNPARTQEQNQLLEDMLMT